MTARSWTEMLHGDRRVDKSQAIQERISEKGGPVLLLDAEHHQTLVMAQAQAYMDSMLGYTSPLRLDRARGILIHGASHKENVRRNWYWRNGLWDQYVPKQITGPILLKFSYWEQAEARHKNDVARVLTSEEREAQELRRRVADLKGRRFLTVSEQVDESFDQSSLKRFTGDEWIETKTYNKRTEAWIPLGFNVYMSGSKLPRVHDTDERVKEIDFDKEKG